MRVETYNQIANLYKTTNVNKVQNETSIGGRDEVQISQVGRDYQIAKQAVEQSPDIRNDKVAQVKARVESGQYNVGYGEFAAKLIERYNANL
ncbi:flagellar biosynthesis anti-sigma factor FlgM [Lachnospiraceae bacterium ZAX-1]